MIPTLDDLRAGGKAALARALATAEARPDAPAVADLLDEAARCPRAHVLGLTGPPGVGKSSLCSALIGRFRSRGLGVGVIAVDPSSRRSGGALLGDRTRFEVDPDDHGVFVRSMAARDRLGGLAAETYAAVALMRALVDRLIVETVGVGQSETDVVQVADLVLLCIQPGSGDSLQYMKAGIAEVPDLAVVTKADLGALAGEAKAEIEAAWQLGAATAPDVRLVSAISGDGIDALLEALEARWMKLGLDGSMPLRRAEQHRRWALELIRDRFGRTGAGLVRERIEGEGGSAPFRTLLAASLDLDARLGVNRG
ncbi:MAG TPA: methylmalonyl Co-A mutase-associated GTPase MeaB [Geminicoccaceae bacterium]